MSAQETEYWEDLSQWFSFAFHQLAYVPACCLHFIEQEIRTHNRGPRISHKPRLHQHNYSNSELIDPRNTQADGSKSIIQYQPHLCKSCGFDIISQAQSSQARAHTKLENFNFQDWLSNDRPTIDLTQTLPHASGFEQNLAGFEEEHLQRVEKYWAEHQLTSPNCALDAKATKIATVADWQKALNEALEQAELRQ